MDSGSIVGAIVGASGALFLVVLLVVAAVIILLAYSRRTKPEAWEIDYHEIECGEQIDEGGFGIVYKASWKGTEVAVKVLSEVDITPAHLRDFREETRVMSCLRHPNVVLFMAASTKPPKLCIVMEFMGLGSLYEVPTTRTGIAVSVQFSLDLVAVVVCSCCIMNCCRSCPTR